MQYLTAVSILMIHAWIIDETGGTHGVRDANLLASLVERPKATFGGKELHEGVFLKAAVLCEALVNYHVFIDGNKRTAFVVLGRFLAINDFAFECSNEEVVETMIAIAEKRLDVPALVDWIKDHTK
jgi:death-on-curing protein